VEGQDAALRLLEAELAKHREGGEFGGVFPGRWLPSAVAVLDEPFTEQNHLLNSTMKMVRGKIAQHHADRIESLYTPEGRSILNDRNRARSAVSSRRRYSFEHASRTPALRTASNSRGLQAALPGPRRDDLGRRHRSFLPPSPECAGHAEGTDGGKQGDRRRRAKDPDDGQHKDTGAKAVQQSPNQRGRRTHR